MQSMNKNEKTMTLRESGNLETLPRQIHPIKNIPEQYSKIPIFCPPFSVYTAENHKLQIKQI